MGAVEYLKERTAVLKQQELELRKKEQENVMEMEKQGTNNLGRIQGLTKGGSDKRPPKAVGRRGVGGSGGMFPPKIFNFGPLKCDFQRFQGQFQVVFKPINLNQLIGF